MAEYMKKASKNLQASQELQKQWHDQKAVLIQYQPGQKVWVLEPVAPRAVQDKWSGPHLIVEKKGEVTYLVDLGTARGPLRVLHVNRLKPYYDRADLTLLMATDEGQEEESDPLPDLFSSTEQDALVEGVVLADCLTAEQKDNCINLLGQFSELFSTVPGDFFRAPGAERRQATPRVCTNRKQSRRQQDQRYKVAVVVFATLLRFCRRPEKSAVDPLVEGEERDAEELW
ncbi:hypothetical protein NDU88_005358 [Pleurodeles waltl]|uniref:Integrase p58-like C-terminal domain-containing protein n=1 Tax=Pleurodeles waltl TaxID=8319 RepID=A0AAV7NM77_PLEWA|nr:hypothetical protein NDU88_005358 [Pleurodeles waltl]